MPVEAWNFHQPTPGADTGEKKREANNNRKRSSTSIFQGNRIFLLLLSSRDKKQQIKEHVVARHEIIENDSGRFRSGIK